ncbi:EGFR adapter protein-like isoform X2 [Dermacentor albipictus]|uniref:EGFR adapter protein-like isoform X2 n=1 Tax=Dermacentor albipictus TaxID=60249 RepID=UPI0038FC56D5
MSEDESDVDLDPAHQLVRLRRRLPAFKQRPPPSSDDSDASEDPLPDGYCHRKSTSANSCWTISDLSRLDGSGPLSPAAKTGYMCEYVGSFDVSDNDVWVKPELMEAQLFRMRASPSKRTVLILVTLTGVKVCTTDGKAVLMAHAVQRICWATCNPGQFQFAFLAREPRQRADQRHCHVFRTRSPRQVRTQAEDLSSLVGSAFRMAYARQLQQQHHQQQQQQHHQQQQQRQGLAVQSPRSASPAASAPADMAKPGSPASSPCKTAITAPAANGRPEASPPNAYTKVWAKKVAGRTKHRDPVAESFLELNVRSLQQQHYGALSGSARPSSVPVTPSHQHYQRPGERGADPDLLSPSSNEDNTSPTELNRHFTDKPPPVKKLEDSWQQQQQQQQQQQRCSPSIGGPDGLEDSRASSPVPMGSRPPSSALRSSPLSSEACSVRSSVRSRRSSGSPSGRQRSASGSPRPNGLATRVAFAPAPPRRHDSLNVNEEEELREAPWYQAGIPREIALEVLSQEPIGSFLVRQSSTKPGCFALSLRVPRSIQPSGIAHYLIMHTNRGYKIKGFTKEFSTLTSLITHHSVMPELLPCPLSLYRYNSTFRKHGSAEDMVDIDEDPDYTLLSDFRKMMADAV